MGNQGLNGKDPATRQEQIKKKRGDETPSRRNLALDQGKSESARECLCTHLGRNNVDSARRRCNSSGNHSWVLRNNIAIDDRLRAVLDDVASLSAAVAGLASGTQRTAVGSSAVARNVAKLSASVALLGLGLAVASEVVRAAALVAHGRTATSETTTHEATTRSTGAATHARHAGSRAIALRR